MDSRACAWVSPAAKCQPKVLKQQRPGKKPKQLGDKGSNIVDPEVTLADFGEVDLDILRQDPFSLTHKVVDLGTRLL